MKLIDKDKIVEEIERRLWLLVPKVTFYQQRAELEKLLSFINTLEVKEVDLEKEIDDYTKDILACDIQWEPFTHLYNCAKYFYELGLKAQKGK